jgi:hypothetical protein
LPPTPEENALVGDLLLEAKPGYYFVDEAPVTASLKFPSISHRKCQEIGRKSIGCASA